MKKKDLLLIGVVVIIAAIISFVVSGSFITTPEDRKQKVEIVDAISTEFTRPPAKYFNSKSVNPTQTIQIGQDPNNKPFGTE